MRLGDLDALKEELKNYFSDGLLDSVSAKLAFNMILRKIDDTPTVEEDKIIQCHSIESKSNRDKYRVEFIDGYKKGYKQAILDGKTNYSRQQGKWIARTEDNGVNYRFYCSCCNREVLLITDYCPNCGADMRKPNCVTCDHFGKCEGCDKGEEE